MSDNPRQPRRPLGDRDEKDPAKPFGGRFGERPDEKPKPSVSPTDPYPWARDEDEVEEKPAPPPDPNRLDPTAPYPWAKDEEVVKPAPPPDPNRVPPTAPYPWADEKPAPKAPPPEARKVDPTAPYPWARDDDEEPPAPARPPRGVDPTAPYPWAEEKPAPRPAPPEARKVDPTAPYPWADEKPEEKPAPPPEPGRVAPTAPYPWSDEPPPPPVPAPPTTSARPPARPAPADPLDDEDGPDPSSLSWADLIAGVDEAEAAPPEAGLIDEAPLEPPLPSEAAPADRPKLSDARRALPTEQEAPPERVTDRFLKRGTFLRRPAAGAIPARSYLEAEAPPPEPIAIQIVPLLNTLALILVAAALVATLFTWWTPNSFLPAIPAGQLAIAQATQVSASAVAVSPVPSAATFNNIGIVSGHRGINPSSGLPDPGAVCADGLTEESVNATIATKTAQLLQAAGYQVDTFDEFDPKLQGYQALAMVSIHADSCEYINDQATGFKVASFQSSTQPERDARLVNCLIEHYADRTGLPLHPGVTYDMTDYHNFREIDAKTPGVIVETGFLYLDRSFLTSRPDDSARGIAEGVLCFLRGESPVPLQTPAALTPAGIEEASPTPLISPTPSETPPLFTTSTPSITPLPPDQVTPGP